MISIIFAGLLLVSSNNQIYLEGYTENRKTLILMNKFPGIDRSGSEIFIRHTVYQDLSDLVELAAKEGIYLKINYGFRSNSLQKKLFKQNPQLSAPPGKSSHQEGISIDIAGTVKKHKKTHIYYWLSKNSNKFHFKNTIKKEPWHWSWYYEPTTYHGSI